MSDGADSACASPLVTIRFRVVVPAASAPVVDLVAERGKFVHYTPFAGIVVDFALDIGEAVQLVRSQLQTVRLQLVLAKLLELRLSGESLAIRRPTFCIHQYPPRLFEVVEEEDQ